MYVREYVVLHVESGINVASLIEKKEVKDRHCVRRGKVLRLEWDIRPIRKLFASSGSSRGGGGGNEFAEALRCQRAAWRFSELAGRCEQ